MSSSSGSFVDVELEGRIESRNAWWDLVDGCEEIFECRKEMICWPAARHDKGFQEFGLLRTLLKGRE